MKNEKILADLRRGLTMVYTGDGKGKTTAAFGLALRALGHNYRVFVVQFMKGRKYGEYLCAEKYLPGIKISLEGLDSFVMRDKPSPVDIELAKNGLALAEEVIYSGAYDMIILDEINVALDFHLLDLQDVLKIITNKPSSVDLVLTGRYVPQEIIDAADMVSEVKNIKHHYGSGIKDRPGIEY